MGLLEALAAVLTRESELATLREHPARLRRRYGLSDAELAMLTGASPAGLRVTGESVRGKLVQKVTTCLPATVAELKAHHPELLNGFAAATVRRPRPGEGVTDSGEAGQLVTWIDGRVPAPLVDFARYELLCGQLAGDRRAAQAAGEPILAPDGPLRGTPSVSPAVRVAFFDHDVTAEPPPSRLPARRTSILLRRQWGEPALRVYRINDATAALLGRCDGTRSVAEVIAEMIAEVGADAEQVTGMLTRFAAAGVVRLAPGRY
ncbi:PqqD family protein [Streptosporangium sp. NPDC049644]|uniref:PqqD family protein n=1 Tax=Streptosporangium sp. NPDC049644 TaxID=3155507 RepID=UPI003438A073